MKKIGQMLLVRLPDQGAITELQNIILEDIYFLQKILKINQNKL